MRYDHKLVCPIPPELAAPMEKVCLALAGVMKSGASGEELAALYLKVRRLATSVRLEEMRRIGAK